MKVKNKISYCCDCDAPVRERKCRRCGLPLCDDCYHVWTGLCSACCDDDKLESNMDNNYASGH